MSLRRLRHLAVLTACGAVLFSGCAGARPNVAVQVDDRSVALSTVDGLTDIACAPKNFSLLVQSENPVPRSVLRTSIASLAGMDLALDGFVAAQGLDDRAAVEKQRNSIESELEATLGAEDAGRMAGVLGAQARFSSALQQVGQKALLGSDPAMQGDPQAVMAAGQQEWQDWLQDQDIAIDPRLSLNLVDPGKVPQTGSIPVSEFARSATASGQEPSVEGLPANQVCG